MSEVTAIALNAVFVLLEMLAQRSLIQVVQLLPPCRCRALHVTRLLVVLRHGLILLSRARPAD